MLFFRAVERKKKAVERCEEQLIRMEVQATDREENKQIALGTSKLNYLDPRISVAWSETSTHFSLTPSLLTRKAVFPSTHTLTHIGLELCLFPVFVSQIWGLGWSYTWSVTHV